MANFFDQFDGLTAKKDANFFDQFDAKTAVPTGQDVAASALSGLGRGIPETLEFLGAATATLPSAAISAARGQYQGLGNEFQGLMAQAPLTPVLNQAFGKAYQPQTEAGRYARAMGAGASTGVIGGIPGVLSGLVGGAGAEAGGDVAAMAGEEYRPVGGLIGGLLGGASTYRYGAAPVARGLTKPAVDVPTADDIRALANQKYQQAAEAGGVFSPALSNKFLAEATKGFEAPSELAARAAKPSEALKYIEDFRVFADKPMSLADAQYLDEYLGDSIDTFVDATTGKVSKQGQKLVQVQDTLRRTIMDAPESEIVGGRAGVDALAEGRSLWQRQAKLRDIEKIISRAELTQNPAQSLKTGFRNLLTNPNRIRGFSADEKALVRNAAESGRVGDLMQTMGSRLIPVISAATGGGVTGVLGAAAATGLSRTGASAAQMGRANRLVESVAIGQPVGVLQRASGLARNVAGEVGGQVASDLGVINKLIGNQGGYLKLPGQSFADDLPMDTASRMQRAREMGFDVDNPVYHGTGADIAQFKPSIDGKMGAGVYLSDSPVYSSSYANREGGNVIKAVTKGNIAGGKEASAASEQARMMLKNDPKTAELPAREFNQLWREKRNEILAQQGFDGLKLSDETVVFDPKNIRSVNAAFDPAKKDSANLLAGIAPLGVVGLLAAGQSNAQDMRSAGLLLAPGHKTPVRINVTPTRMK